MDEDGRKAFGAYIKSLREGAGLTQKEAAKRAALSAPYLAQLEKGQRNPPSRAALTRLAQVYNIMPQILWEQAEYGSGMERVQLLPIDPERVEWLFQAATSDPAFSYGHRARKGPLTLDQKMWFVQLWQETSGRNLFTGEEEAAMKREEREIEREAKMIDDTVKEN